MTKPEPPHPPHHPAVLAEAEKRRSNFELRIADHVTAFAGSMKFVYVSIAVFATWMLVFEDQPWPTLTLTVSLEAIFLSTFVMIGQNRQSALERAKADRDYADVNKLLIENTELTRAIQKLTEDEHALLFSTLPDNRAAKPDTGSA